MLIVYNKSKLLFIVRSYILTLEDLGYCQINVTIASNFLYCYVEDN